MFLLMETDLPVQDIITCSVDQHTEALVIVQCFGRWRNIRAILNEGNKFHSAMFGVSKCNTGSLHGSVFVGGVCSCTFQMNALGQFLGQVAKINREQSRHSMCVYCSTYYIVHFYIYIYIYILYAQKINCLQKRQKGITSNREKRQKAPQRGIIDLALTYLHFYSSIFRFSLSSLYIPLSLQLAMQRVPFIHI